MKTSEILEKFLPDYYRRDDVARLDDLHKFLCNEMSIDEEKESGLRGLPYSDVFEEFIEQQDEMLEEALSNLADGFGKKQRENCHQVVHRQIECTSNENFELAKALWAIYLEHKILKSEQPKIEEL
jgi:hypothetical protein